MQVDLVRSVLNDPANANLTESEMYSKVVDALGHTDDLHKRRRVLQAANTTDISQAVERLIRFAAGPAVWDPRSPATSNGRSWDCPIADQGKCGSCVSFSSIAAAEYAVAVARSARCPVQLSQQFQFFW